MSPPNDLVSSQNVHIHSARVNLARSAFFHPDNSKKIEHFVQWSHYRKEAREIAIPEFVNPSIY
jgi:hypothetical protein